MVHVGEKKFGAAVPTPGGYVPKFPRLEIWHGQRGHVTTVIPEAAFSAVRFCGYTALRRTKYDRPSLRQLRFLL